MVKLASIDLGSNSTRLLIAEVDDQGFNVLIRKHVITKMSENTEQTGVISTEAFKRVNSTLRDFKKLLIANDVNDVFVVGTAALRDAKNSNEIIKNIRNKYGFEVEGLSGHEEGITTSIGVLHFMQNTENFLIIDIGGRSTEFIYEFENKIVSKSYFLLIFSIISSEFFASLSAAVPTTKTSSTSFSINNFLKFLKAEFTLLNASVEITPVCSIFSDIFVTICIRVNTLSPWSLTSAIKSLVEFDPRSMEASFTIQLSIRGFFENYFRQCKIFRN